MAVSCATSQGILPEKYNLDAYLEQVDQISTFRTTSWEQVDKQSIIIETSWKNYYLLILRRPLDSFIPESSIGITGKGSTIVSGIDKVVVNDFDVKEYYVIEKIYKLSGKDQAGKIKKRLLKNNNTLVCFLK